MTDQQWMELALFAGARDACVMEAREIPFDEKFRSACEENLCGCYNRNWACPPHAGNINTLIERARAYDRALIYITVHDVSNSREEHGFEGLPFWSMMKSQGGCRMGVRPKAYCICLLAHVHCVSAVQHKTTNPVCIPSACCLPYPPMAFMLRLCPGNADCDTTTGKTRLHCLALFSIIYRHSPATQMGISSCYAVISKKYIHELEGYEKL